MSRICFWMIKVLDDHTICFYRTQKVDLHVTDTDDIVKNQTVTFESIHIQDYNMILEFSWLKKINSDIKWQSNDWQYQTSES